MSDGGGESARDSLFRFLSGFRLTQALYVSAKLGMADRLAAGPKDAETLAREVGVDPDRLFRVLRALASFGVLSLDGAGRFRLTELGEYLRTDVPGSLEAFAVFSGEESYRAFGELLHTVRTGETAFDHVYGMGHFDYLAQHPDASTTFHRWMAGALGALDDPLEGFDLHDRRVLVDVGGGQGALLALVLRNHTELKGILFDLPTALTDAPEYLESFGVRDRCEILSGSAFEFVPPGGDAYVMSRILHDWTDDKALEILRNCRRAIPQEGVLLLREVVLKEGTLPPAQALLDLVMMAMTGGRERTENDWRQLLHRAGFILQRVTGGRGNQSLIEAIPGPVSSERQV